MTVYLDRRFRNVGRIKRSAGTAHKPTVKLLNAMLDGLFQRGRSDILKSIRDGEYTPLEVWEYYRTGELERLPNAKTLAPLVASMKKWIKEKDCSQDHRLSVAQSIRYLEREARSTATTNDLPGLVEALRPKLKPSSFNKLRTHAQSYLKATVKRSHPLYRAVQDIEPRTVITSRKAHPLTVDEMRAFTKKLKNPRHARNAWDMFLSGMGPNEYWGNWSIGVDRIHVYGTKRKGRDRDIPLIERLSTPYATPKAFSEALKHVDGIIVTPYDFRRSYANLLESAGIPRTRRMMYLGHGTRDVTDLYERHEVSSFLVTDAEKLRSFVGATEPSGLKIHA